MRARRRSVAGLIALVAVGLVGLGRASTAGEVRIEGAWVREAPPGAGSLAVFLTVVNRSAQPVRLVGATSPAARAVALHRTREEAGLMRMDPVATIEIPPNGRAVLAPGGFHLMLVEPVRRFVAGDTLSLTLVFEPASRLSLEVPVRTAPPEATHAPVHGGHGGPASPAATP